MSFRGEGRMSGVRGGASHFNWDDVKKIQKDRDLYIGACMKASVNGRRDKDRDFFWYNKSTDTLGRSLSETPEQAKARRRLEVLERKRADAEALADALGETAESRRRADQVDLEISELKSLLERGSTERDQLLSTERVAGLGAAPAQRHEGASRSATVAAEDDRMRREGRERELLAADAARRTCRDVAAAAPTNDGGGFVTTRGAAVSAADARPDAGDLKRKRKEEKREAKKARKEEKKEAKKARKEAKKARKDDGARTRAADFM